MKAVKRNVLKGFRCQLGDNFLTVYPNIQLSVKDTEDPEAAHRHDNGVRPFLITRLALPDLQSGGNEYKDMLSDKSNGITNADTQRDGIANPVEQPAEDNGVRPFFIMRSALPDLQSGGNEYKDMLSGNDNGITNADTQRDGIANPVEHPAEDNGVRPFLYTNYNELFIN